MAGRLTTHVLDVASGRPAAGLAIELWRIDGEARRLKVVTTNIDGRVDGALLEGADLAAGTYELLFHAGDYLRASRARSDPAFLDVMPIRFGIADAAALSCAAAALALWLFHLPGELSMLNATPSASCAAARSSELADVPTRCHRARLVAPGRALAGTKEGCNEGDCGACTVALGCARDGRVVYEPVNACILLVGMLEGTELVTVDDLADGGELHPVQQALVGLHGSQCGFCTPGFVMSLFTLYQSRPGSRAGGRHPHRRQSLPLHRLSPDRRCRMACCAGRRDDRWPRVPPPPARWRPRGWRGCLRAARRELLRTSGEPRHTGTAVARHPDATIVSGATDVGLWITKQMRHLPKIIHRRRESPVRRRQRNGRRPDARRRRDLRASRMPLFRHRSRHRRGAAAAGLDAGAGGGHRRRQHRQRLAHRRYAADADRAGRHARSGLGRQENGACRWRISSSPMASRTASAGEFVWRIHVPKPQARRGRPLLQDRQALRPGYFRRAGRLQLHARGRRVSSARIALWRHGGNAQARRAAEAALTGARLAEPATLAGGHRRAWRGFPADHRHARLRRLSRRGGAGPAAKGPHRNRRRRQPSNAHHRLQGGRR